MYWESFPERGSDRAGKGATGARLDFGATPDQGFGILIVRPGMESVQFWAVRLGAGDNWKLSISDNGIGVPDAHAGRPGQTKSRLGTSIVKALAQRLEAGVDVLSGTTGTIVSITHATLAGVRVGGR